MTDLSSAIRARLTRDHDQAERKRADDPIRQALAAQGRQLREHNAAAPEGDHR